MPQGRAEREQIVRLDEKVEGQLAADRQYHQRQQAAQLLAAQIRPHLGAELRPHDRPQQQQQRQIDVDGLVQIGLQKGGVGGYEDIWNSEVPTTTTVGMPSR